MRLVIQNIIKDTRLLFFSLALMIYAFWSSPTPDNPGWIEVAIAGLLVTAIGIITLFRNTVVCFVKGADFWQISGGVFFVYGLTVSLILASVQENSVGLILRDLSAFVFLCLPLFIVPFVMKNKIRTEIILYLAIAIGFIFSLRVLFLDLGWTPSVSELLYLANSSFVLLAALFFTVKIFEKLFKGVNVKHVLEVLLLTFLSAIVLAAMFVDLQRASFIAVALSLVIIGGVFFVKAPLRALYPVLFFVIAIVLWGSLMGDVIENIALKTAKVGLNMRVQEFYAVWEVGTHSAITFLFGHGWGSSFASPAVGGLQVTYTHSLLTYAFFKGGFIGLTFCLIYLFFIFEKLVRLYFTDPVKGNALMWPFLIPIFLYASHKSFDFGFILSLILIQGLSLQPSKEAAA